MTQDSGGVVLILGSAPGVIACQSWPRAPFDRIVTINNAWSVRPDWDVAIYPEDFLPARRPADLRAGQRIVQADTFVPAQNRYGGFVFAGGTMAFTTAYWVLDALRPRVMAFLGCDMVYDTAGQTHFYGNGTADPLRDDVTLRDLGAKSARLGAIAAMQGCACVNLSEGAESALAFPRTSPQAAGNGVAPRSVDAGTYASLRAQEAALKYETPDGRYWDMAKDFDSVALAGLDRDWRALWDAKAA